METINDRIIKLRKLSNVTQIQLAQKLNVSDKLISKWECGDSSPSVDDVLRLSQIFGVSLDYLLKGIISPQDDKIINRPPTWEEKADLYIEKCLKIIKDKGLIKYKDLLVPKKGATEVDYRGRKLAQSQPSLIGGVFRTTKFDNYQGYWWEDYMPYLDIAKLLALDNYDLYAQLIDLPATFGDLRKYLKEKNDVEGLRITTPKNQSSNAWTRESEKRLTVSDIQNLTDERFYIKVEDKDEALRTLNLDNKNYWVIVRTLIENGAKKTYYVNCDSYSERWHSDLPGTAVLYEMALLKTKK